MANETGKEKQPPTIHVFLTWDEQAELDEYIRRFHAKKGPLAKAALLEKVRELQRSGT